MKKIILMGPKSISRQAIQTLQEIGTVHLSESEGFKKASTSRKDEKIGFELAIQEKILSKSDTLLSLLPKPMGSHSKPAEIRDVDEKYDSRLPSNIETWLNEISSQAHDLSQKKQALSDEEAVLKAYQGAIRTLTPLLEPLQNSKNFEAIGFIVLKRESRRLEELEKEFLKLFPDKILIFKRTIDEDSLGIIIAFPRTLSSPVRSYLNRLGLNELKMPSSLSDIPLHQAIQHMEQRLQEIPKLLEKINLELKNISSRDYSLLKRVKIEVENKINALKAMKNLGQTEKAFMMTGFNPEKDIARLEKTLKDRFGSSLHLEVEDCENAPVLLDNHKLIRPFELFINILRPPKYGSIDPTPFFALFFPIFFGLIMGDVGYGLVFLSLAIFLKKRVKQEMIQSISQIIFICSIYTMIFGFVFGECFGDWLEHLGLLHPLKMHIGSTVIEWNRMHSLVPLLMLSIGIGVFHVTLGFILKLIQSIKHKHHHETVEVIAILVALTGLFALIGVLAQQIPSLVKIPSIVALLVAIPLLIGMKGPLMIMELLSFVGNMLSYARLMAVGVASAYLAFVGNMLGGLMGNVILGAVIAILFHIINMVLAFSPTIQSARLHYVEFFSKFYESGGNLYQPFARKQQG